MFSIYVSLTKGQHPSFKHFLCGGNKAISISDEFLTDQLRCFLLYHCFHEAGDFNICRTIEQSVILNKVIDLPTNLTTSDVECVTTFLTSSFQKKWVWLKLPLQDHGLHILHRGLLHGSNITIKRLSMRNGLTTKSSSLISEITVKCKVKVLNISGNRTIGENEQLYSMLTNPYSVLEELCLENTKLKLSSKGANALFNALKENYTIKELNISFNNITDDACDAITTVLKRNSCLVRLKIHHNPLTDEAITSIYNG